MAKHFNKLTPAEDERLAFLLEEMGEAIQIIGKIQRHGYESYDPTLTQSPTNRTMLEKELGDVLATIELLKFMADVDPRRLTARVSKKLEKLEGYAHHNGDVLFSILLERRKDGPTS